MKYVLITGGTGGIGYELARCFLRTKHTVIIVSANHDRLEKAKKKLEKEFQLPVLTYEQDLAVLGGAETLYQKIKQDGISVDILVNNAGFGLAGSTIEIDMASDEKLMILNMISLVELSKFYIADMYKKGKGKILNVASIGAFQPAPNTSTYCASKAFVLSYSRAIRYEAKGTGVQVSTLCPGPTKTDFFRKEGLPMPIEAMSAEKCAVYGYEKFMKNKEIIIPGLLNRIKISMPTPLKMLFISRLKSNKNKIG